VRPSPKICRTSLACDLGMRFWQDLERHNPGISSLNLSREVADAWKERLRTKTETVTGPDGTTAQVQVPRLNYWECLIPVRAFYLDIAQWAADDPARWGPWVAPCPVRDEETSRRKERRHRKSRMDARTRERLPVLPVLVQTVTQRLEEARELLEAARPAGHGESFAAGAQTLTRVVTRRGTAVDLDHAADLDKPKPVPYSSFINTPLHTTRWRLVVRRLRCRRSTFRITEASGWPFTGRSTVWLTRTRAT
jgi:hypothetical protein